MYGHFSSTAVNIDVEKEREGNLPVDLMSKNKAPSVLA
jgi:hypothetical protein